ncbi:MAG: ATP-binding protein, partial [Deltaproteobacteria bacterium]
DALRESEAWLRMSQEIAKLGTYVFDVRKDHWSSSTTLNEIFGIDPGYPRTGAAWIRIVHPDDRPAMERYLEDLLSGGSRFDHEYRVVDQATQRVKWVHGLGELERSADGAPVRLVGTIQDVTDRKVAEEGRLNLQAQLDRSARLAAMGTLVAGVAHEINNPLSGVQAGGGIAMELAQEARRLATEGAAADRDELARLLDETVDSLRDTQHGGQRIAQIVKDLSLLARPDPMRARVRIIEIVDQAMRWLPVSVGRAVTLRVEDRGAPDVMASFGQIGQVLVNLVTNAAKATPRDRKGEVVVRLGPGDPGMARIDVIDDGVGMAPDVIERIFDPFFTTSPAGEGTGLGLPISHAIVTAHGGAITVESAVGKGSTFRVELPSVSAEA